MSDRSLFGLPSESQRLSLLLILFVLVAIPITLGAILTQRQTTSYASTCFDINSDGIVQTTDASLLKTEIDQGDYNPKHDFNSDGTVNGADLSLLERNLNTSCLPKISFFADPDKVASGGSVTLRWSVDEATSVSIEGLGGVDSEGSQEVAPTKSSTYTLTATNAAGTVKASTDVTVTP